MDIIQISVKLNKQLVQINRNFVVCFIVTAIVSWILPKTFPGFDDYPEFVIIDIIEVTVFFGIFFILFYRNNGSRYRQMERSSVKKKLIKLTSILGIGVILLILAKWISMYYFLTINWEPFGASLMSSVIAIPVYMAVVTITLQKTKTF